MQYLFTGTGRCGTAYLARYLTAAGLPTAHEALCQPFRKVQPWEWAGIEREVSWVGQFWLQFLPPECEVVHVIRDPRAVYDSFMTRKFFEPVLPAEACTQTRYFFQETMYAIDPALKKLAPSEATERWIIGTHERLAKYQRVYIDKGDLHQQLEHLLLSKLTRREIPYTNLGHRETHEHPAYIMKLAEELGYV